jgi:hypothetical protein
VSISNTLFRSDILKLVLVFPNHLRQELVPVLLEKRLLFECHAVLGLPQITVDRPCGGRRPLVPH